MNIKESRKLSSLESTAWPLEIRKNLNQALLQLLPCQSLGRFLEVGTGSGRTTRSLLESDLALETELVGVDISLTKLRRLLARTQSSPLNPVQADARSLPFPAGSFDIILTIHLLHLIRDWMTALLEFQRLLRPGGAYVRRGDKGNTATIWDQMRQQWLAILEAANLPQRHQTRRSQAIDDFLLRLGASHSSIHLGSKTWASTPKREIDRISVRTGLGTWQVPQQIMPQLLDALRSWAILEYGSLDQDCYYDEDIILDIWRF